VDEAARISGKLKKVCAGFHRIGLSGPTRLCIPDDILSSEICVVFSNAQVDPLAGSCSENPSPSGSPYVSMRRSLETVTHQVLPGPVHVPSVLSVRLRFASKNERIATTEDNAMRLFRGLVQFFLCLSNFRRIRIVYRGSYYPRGQRVPFWRRYL